MSGPIDTSFFIMDPLSFAKFCGDDIMGFHSELLMRNELIPLSPKLGLGVPSSVNLPIPAPWLLVRGDTHQFLVTRRLVDTRNELTSYLAESQDLASELLKKYEARYLGPIFFYPGLDVARFRFDIALGLPFWTQEQGEKEMAAICAG